MDERFGSHTKSKGPGKEDAAKAWLRLTAKDEEMAYWLIFIGAVAESQESLVNAASRTLQLGVKTSRAATSISPELVLRGVSYAVANLKARSLELTELNRMLGFVKAIRLQAEAELKPKAKTTKTQVKVKAEAEVKATEQVKS